MVFWLSKPDTRVTLSLILRRNYCVQCLQAKSCQRSFVDRKTYSVSEREMNEFMTSANNRKFSILSLHAEKIVLRRYIHILFAFSSAQYDSQEISICNSFEQKRTHQMNFRRDSLFFVEETTHKNGTTASTAMPLHLQCPHRMIEEQS